MLSLSSDNKEDGIEYTADLYDTDVTWCKKIKPIGKPKDRAVQGMNQKQDTLLMSSELSQYNRAFGSFKTVRRYVDRLVDYVLTEQNKKNNYTVKSPFHEHENMLPHEYVRLYADIDIKPRSLLTMSEPEFIDHFLKVFESTLDYFGHAESYFSSNCLFSFSRNQKSPQEVNPNKFSCHFIFDQKLASRNTEQKAFWKQFQTHWTLNNLPFPEMIDMQAYDKGKSMRCIFSSKSTDSDYILLPYNTQTHEVINNMNLLSKEELIGYFIHTDGINQNEKERMQEKKNKELSFYDDNNDYLLVETFQTQDSKNSQHIDELFGADEISVEDEIQAEKKQRLDSPSPSYSSSSSSSSSSNESSSPKRITYASWSTAELVEQAMKDCKIVGLKVSHYIPEKKYWRLLKINPNSPRSCILIPDKNSLHSGTNNAYIKEFDDCLIYYCFSDLCRGKRHKIYVRPFTPIPSDKIIYNTWTDLINGGLPVSAVDEYISKITVIVNTGDKLQQIWLKKKEQIDDFPTWHPLDYKKQCPWTTHNRIYCNGLRTQGDLTELSLPEEEDEASLKVLKIDKSVRIAVNLLKRFEYLQLKNKLRLCTYVDFIPYGPLIDPKSHFDSRLLNIFPGWKYPVSPSFNPDKIKLILHHILVMLCNNSEPTYRVFLDFYAHLVQKPTEKVTFALLLTSPQGIGKDTLFEFLESVIGSHLCASSNKVEEFLGKFNSLLENKLLVCFNEIETGQVHKTYNRIKSIITNTKTNIRKLYRDVYVSRDYAHSIVTRALQLRCL